MIKSLKIKNLKSIQEQKILLSPLSILTGTNSAGKSSVIQALLLCSYHAQENLHLGEYLSNLGDFLSLLNFEAKKKEIFVHAMMDDEKKFSLSMNEKETIVERGEFFPVFEKQLFYLCANRLGQENIAKSNQTLRGGISGEYLFGYYETNKNTALSNEKLIHPLSSSQTLSTQVQFWLNSILDLNLEPKTQRINTINVSVTYKNNDLEGLEVSPYNLGAGVSYLSKILILGLSLQQGDVFIVENPEVHLHPRAISQLAHFFVFLIQAGVQVILETHSEHIINKMRYVIYKKEIQSCDVQIYYKDRSNSVFMPIGINEDGRFVDEQNEVIAFPAGFFDSNLHELLEMA